MSEPRKIPADEQRELIADSEVHRCFLCRDDIASLPPDEQDRLWSEHLAKLSKFREWLATLPAFVID